MMFAQLYEWVLRWAEHHKATWVLGGLSFAESSFFPIPPDVLLAPMTLAKPEKAWHYAFITTIMSVLGGAFGYIIGYYFYDLIQPYFQEWHWMDAIASAKSMFDTYGIWVVFIAGFSPIPYKVSTITAGLLSMSFIPFILASLIGRGLRFYLVAAIVKIIGDKYEPFIKRYIEPIGYILAILLCIIIGYLVFSH